MKLLGLDHADVRVSSIPTVERFFDAVLPALGLSRKTGSHVGLDGEWYDVDDSRPRNVVEHHTPIEVGSSGWFVGFIEDPASPPTATRIAFTLDRENALPEVAAIVHEAGGRHIESSIDAGYPALFSRIRSARGWRSVLVVREQGNNYANSFMCDDSSARA